ncbi:MAG: ACT domain-containing protein [Solobacterium sp.]|nr:ACT domain-containing protein [Solobacterium sp.]
MSSDFLIVKKEILPDYLEKVIYARNLLNSKEAATITEAVRMAGISRNTYYKYKDCVYAPTESASPRHAVVSLILKDENGSLSAVLQKLSECGTGILTISQAIPIAGKANVLISLDVSNMNVPMETLLKQLKTLSPVRSAHLDAME